MRAIEFTLHDDALAYSQSVAYSEGANESTTTQYKYVCAEGKNGKHYLLINDDITDETVVNIVEDDLLRSVETF